MLDWVGVEVAVYFSDLKINCAFKIIVLVAGSLDFGNNFYVGLQSIWVLSILSCFIPIFVGKTKIPHLRTNVLLCDVCKIREKVH